MASDTSATTATTPTTITHETESASSDQGTSVQPDVSLLSMVNESFVKGVLRDVTTMNIMGSYIRDMLRTTSFARNVLTPVCPNCRQLIEDHLADGKCLFGPGHTSKENP